MNSLDYKLGDPSSYPIFALVWKKKQKQKKNKKEPQSVKASVYLQSKNIVWSHPLRYSVPLHSRNPCSFISFHSFGQGESSPI